MPLAACKGTHGSLVLTKWELVQQFLSKSGVTDRRTDRHIELILIRYCFIKNVTEAALFMEQLPKKHCPSIIAFLDLEKTFDPLTTRLGLTTLPRSGVRQESTNLSEGRFNALNASRAMKLLPGDLKAVNVDGVRETRAGIGLLSVAICDAIIFFSFPRKGLKKTYSYD